MWKSIITNQLNALTDEERKENAKQILAILSLSGWSVKAIAGLLSNIEVESQFNPGQVENGYPLPVDPITAYRQGLGLIQWTPYGANPHPLALYAQETGSDWFNGSMQTFLLNRADDQTVTQGLWGYAPTEDYPQSFQDFKRWDGTPEDAASIWLYNVERPADPGATEEQRRARAVYWWVWILEQPQLTMLPILLAVLKKMKERRKKRNVK